MWQLKFIWLIIRIQIELSFTASASVLITKGSMIAVITSRDNNILTAITISLLFLPPLILSMITTIDWKNKWILMQHPSLILLPVFTFFTFSKIKVACDGSAKDTRIQFSYLYTWINIVTSSVCFGLIFVICRIMVDDDWQSKTLSYWLLHISTILFGFGINLTILFLYLEKWFCACCTCDCFHIKMNITVYDPNKDVDLRKKWIIPLYIPTSWSRHNIFFRCHQANNYCFLILFFLFQIIYKK